MAEAERTIVAEERSGHCAVVEGNCLYVWGGYVSIAENEVFLPSDEIWIYDMDSGIWHTHAMGGDVPPPMSGSCGACVNGIMYIFGGYDENGYTNQLYCVNLHDRGGFTWKKIVHSNGCPPTPRDKLSCWVYKDKIIFFGGYGSKMLSELNDAMNFNVDEASWVGEMFWGWNNEVHVFDTCGDSWIQPLVKGTPPLPRAAHACTAVANKGYVFGGRVVDTRMNDLHCIDLDTWTWHEEIQTSAGRPPGRSWHSFTSVTDNILFLFGGLSAQSVPLSDGWVFNTKSKEWKQLEHLPKNKPRLWHTACLGKEAEVVVFGGSQEDLLSVDTGHCNDLLVFQTQAYSLFRLCLDFIGKNGSALEKQLTWLPQKLYQQVENRILFWANIKKQQRPSETPKTDTACRLPNL
ncbi:kelch domain-containing protein 1 isoform X1 [Erpetoichthys calabaricus]|uniref:kelch domain-containing protein 1 isoform X1 n=1 Tax=Erpetoichthys calabaricus TaxID=27687 RepID=UPI0022348F78|nr:kelch domain-containing protein 1 isoform X1 [Erpetoichthys calabaricus]